MSVTPNAVFYRTDSDGSFPHVAALCLNCLWSIAQPLQDAQRDPGYLEDAMTSHFQQIHRHQEVQAVGQVGPGFTISPALQGPDAQTSDTASPPEEGSESIVTLAKEAVSITQRLNVALHGPESMYEHNLESYSLVLGDVRLAEGCLRDALANIYSSGRTFW